MAAPIGNQFWKLRSSHGRKPIFADPDQLWEACCEYFEWVEANPLREEKVFNGKDGIVRAEVAKARAMTVEGLCLFLDIAKPTWAEYRKREGFEEAVARVDDVIRTQKFEGAAAGLLNGNIIARDLGLSDKQELTGKGGGALFGNWDSLPHFERVKAAGFTFLRTLREAIEAGDEKAREQGIAWLQAIVADAKRLEPGKDETDGTNEAKAH